MNNIEAFEVFLLRSSVFLREANRIPEFSRGGTHRAPPGALLVLLHLAKMELRGHMARSQSEIARHLGFSQSSCQRCAQWLTDNKLILTKRDAGDQRKVVCSLSSTGRRVVQVLHRKVVAAINPIAGQPTNG